MHMQSITLNILNPIEKFPYIINNRYSEIICAKYDSSIMNDAHPVLSGQLCQPPCKSCMANCILFEKESDFCMAFVSATGWLTQGSAHEVCLKYNILD